MEKLIRLTEAAELIGYEVATIRNWVKQGKLKAYRHTPHSEIRVRVSDLEALMQSGSKIAK